MNETTVALFLTLAIQLTSKFQTLQELFAKSRAEGRDPTREELAALDLQDDASRAALQSWIDSQP